jgi:hypothetical protein
MSRTNVNFGSSKYGLFSHVGGSCPHLLHLLGLVRSVYTGHMCLLPARRGRALLFSMAHGVKKGPPPYGMGKQIEVSSTLLQLPMLEIMLCYFRSNIRMEREAN